MNIKQTILALTVIATSGLCASEDTKNAIADGIRFRRDLEAIDNTVKNVATGTAQLVGGGVAAAGLTAIEDTRKKAYFKRYVNGWNISEEHAKKLIKEELPMNGVGPATGREAMRAMYVSTDFIESVVPKKYTGSDFQLNLIKENLQMQKSILQNELPKTFKKYAFFRNLALIWGGLHVYNTYQATKKETYR